MDRVKWLFKVLKETDKDKLDNLLWRLQITTSCHIELRGEAIIFSGGSPDKIIDEFSKIVGKYG